MWSKPLKSKKTKGERESKTMKGEEQGTEAQEKAETGTNINTGKSVQTTNIKASKIFKALDKLSKIMLLISIILLIATCSTQKVVVEGTSMNPTLKTGDTLTVNKLQGLFGGYKRYDVVVCDVDYNGGESIIKRIIGLPGETVRIDDSGNIYINEQLLEDTSSMDILKYTQAGIASDGIKLGANEYFVLGDNRVISLDSRRSEIGNINKRDIVGKIIEDIKNPFVQESEEK